MLDVVQKIILDWGKISGTSCGISPPDFLLASVSTSFLATNGKARKIVVKKTRVYDIIQKWLNMDLLMYAFLRTKGEL